jgi:hypothetical protein
MSVDVVISGGTAPTVSVNGDGGASVSIPSSTGVLSLNGLSGVVSLAVVGGTIAAAGNTLTITVSAGVSSWNDLTDKPATFPPSAHTHAIADTTGLQAALDAKAPIASPTFTGTVGGITKAMVGLSAVDNVADASKPVSTDQAAADAAVQAHAIQRANHTGTQAVGTITGLGSLATQSGTFSGTSSGTNTGDQTATTVSVAGGYGAFTPAALNVESAIQAISGALENKADSSPATTENLGPIRVGTGLGIDSGTLSVSYGTTSTTACVGNDARLSDARTPTAHNQAWSTITSTPTTLAGYGITDGQKTITSGTAAPSGGSSGDIYLRYSA